MSSTRILATTALAAFMATSAFGGVEEISRLDVTVDLAAIQNEEAATFWADLEADLENALIARLSDRMLSADQIVTDEKNGTINGTQITIDIREVELASAFERHLNLGDTVLVGQVNIRDDRDGSNADTYELSLSLETAKIIVPEGSTLVLSTDTEGTYDRMVEAFADNVVERLK